MIEIADPILKVEHLTMRFGGLVAIDDVSFSARNGDITAIIGPNGAGKTTVFNCLTGFYKPTVGMITMTPPTRRRFLLERMEGISIKQGAASPAPSRTSACFSRHDLSGEPAGRPASPADAASGFSRSRACMGLQGVSPRRKAIDKEKARYWLETRGLIDRADDDAGDLPYGAQRRLEIARAMCSDPELLCLDEPAAGLNPRESQDLNATAPRSAKTEDGVGILLIEHDMGVVMGVSDHIVVLDYGKQDRRRHAGRGPGRPCGDRGLPRKSRTKRSKPSKREIGAA
jgi:branched-chain amino acid transport system ATP-binding protein